ncbi:hypothetical protein [Actinoplanes sp. URMC 104]|uniref:hypothetical protein n=1 Tax=Actinoplanes sp. URMC 104 TaxID=3423409 RepID=UPI003F1A21F0
MTAGVAGELELVVAACLAADDSAGALTPRVAALRRAAVVHEIREPTPDRGLVRLAAWVSLLRFDACDITADRAGAEREFAHALRLFLLVRAVRPELVAAPFRALFERTTDPGDERALAYVLIEDDDADADELEMAARLLETCNLPG